MQKIKLILIFCCVFIFVSCTESNSQKVFYQFNDSMNNIVTLSQKPERVIALSGSYADIYMLSGGEIIATTDDAFDELQLDLPEDVKSVGTVKTPNLETVISLKPDFVILSSDIAGHKEIANSFDYLEKPYAFFKGDSFDDYLNMLKIGTDLTGRKDLYIKNGIDIKEKIDAILSTPNDEKVEVLFVRARSQGVSAKANDHFVCTMLDELGALNIASKEKSMLENLSIEQIIAKDPDVILVTTMGDEEKSKKYLKNMWESNPAWKELTAIKENKYVFLPKSLFHYKPNNRWGEAYEQLQEILF